METYRVRHGGEVFYVNFTRVGEDLLYKIRNRGAFYRGGFCRVGIDIFHWNKGLSVTPIDLTRGNICFDVVRET